VAAADAQKTSLTRVDRCACSSVALAYLKAKPVPEALVAQLSVPQLFDRPTLATLPTRVGAHVYLSG
jgi:hypothetical protein